MRGKIFAKRALSLVIVIATAFSMLPFFSVHNSAAPVMTAEEFVLKLVDCAKNYKTLYVMGGFGSPMTEANKTRYINNYEYNSRPERAAMIKAADEDTFGFDCVCLIKGILWGWCGDKTKTYGGAVYASNGVPDLGTEQIIVYCSDVTTTFDHSKMLPGELLWTDGHVGIYIGDGLAVECTPKWENKVQITACNKTISGYNRRDWKKHGKLPYIDYSSVSAGSHVIHDYKTFVRYEDAHPHHAVYSCSCGKQTVKSDKTSFSSSCAVCLETVRPDMPVLNGIMPEYNDTSPIEFNWTGSGRNTTGYVLFIEKDGGEGFAEYERIPDAVPGLTKFLPAGTYRVFVTAYNSVYTEADGSDILRSDSEKAEFIVYPDTATVNAHEPTCTEDGYTGDVVSVSTGEILVSGSAIPATGHDYAAETTPPSCTEGGFTTYICARCGDNYTADEVPAAGHVMEDGKCTVCGYAEPDAEAHVGSADAAPGCEVRLPVTLEGAPPVKSVAVSDVLFDRDVLRLIGADWSLDGAAIADWDSEQEKGVAALKKESDINGDIFILTFYVCDGAAEGVYTVTLKVAAKTADGSDIVILTEAGGVNVCGVLRGDLNRDGAVTDEDAIYLLGNTLFAEEFPLDQDADFNGDGEITRADAVYLLYFTFFPEEFPLG